MNRVTTLSGRLTLALIATIVVVSLVVAMLTQYALSRQAEREMHEKAETSLNYLSGSLAMPLWNISDEVVERICATVAQDDVFAHIEVRDTGRGKVLCSLKRVGETAAYEVTRGVTYRDQMVGEIRLGLSSHPLNQRILVLRWSILGMMVLIVLAILLVMTALVRAYLKTPFDDMTRVVEAFGDGQFDTSASVRYEEFQPFWRVLTQMGQKIGEQMNLLKQVNVDLEKARNVAEDASRAKSTFLANMSHELRTPMNAIMGMTELALRRAEDQKLIDQLDKINLASHHLLNVINDILDISKIEAEHLKLEHVRFRLGEVLENLMSLIRHRADEKNLKLQVELPDELSGITLQGDPMRLGQILLNLSSNAVKFTASGAVTLRGSVIDEDTVSILMRWEVQDTGEGISAEDQQRLFVAFEQADSSMTRKYGGTGLGLAITKRLVQMMGGEIGVSSKLGQGSTFWFTLRMDKATETDVVVPLGRATDALSAETQLREKFSASRILLVEDEPINQEVSRGLLEDAGLVVDLAHDGAQAVEFAKCKQYALILMDVQMPVLNGLDATKAIRGLALNADTPILAMTANAFEDDRQICRNAGMNDHIAKPIRPELLYEVLLRWLARG